MRQRAEIFHLKKEQRSTSRPALAMQLLGYSEPNPLLFLQIWFQQPAGALPIRHTLLAPSQRSEDCVWPGHRNLRLWHGNSSWGTLKRQVHLGGAAPTTSWAKRFPLHFTLRLALWRIFGSTQAVDLSVLLILHGEQRPFLWAVHYPTQELYAPCKAQDSLLSKWRNFPHSETWIRSAENHAGIIKDTCRWQKLFSSQSIAFANRDIRDHQNCS